MPPQTRSQIMANSDAVLFLVSSYLQRVNASPHEMNVHLSDGLLREFVTLANRIDAVTSQDRQDEYNKRLAAIKVTDGIVAAAMKDQDEALGVGMGTVTFPAVVGTGTPAQPPDLQPMSGDELALASKAVESEPDAGDKQ